MGRLFLSKQKYDEPESSDGHSDISSLPSWYERLQKPSSYRIEEDIRQSDYDIPYRSFQRCYSRVLASYTDTFLSLTKPHMRELQARFHDPNVPDNIQQQQIKIDVAVRKLSDLSANTFIMYKRLKVKRLTPPFYLHQQFLVHLGAKNTSKLLDLYFDLPEPRPLYLKREEFERLMSLILRLKISGDHRALIPRVVEVYEDIRQNGNGIDLTPFEETKYFSLLLNSWKEEGLLQEEKYDKVLSLKFDSKKNLKFCPAMWNIMLTHFPEKSEEIMMMMANETGITRSTSEIFLRHLRTYDEFNNALELMKLKYFHVDPWLMDIILERYIDFGKSNEALQLLSETLTVFKDISALNWTFSTQKFQRTELFKIDNLNKTFQQLHNEMPDKPFTWLRYKFKPSPLTVGKLLVSLKHDDQKLKLLGLMKKQDIPLVNKFAVQLLRDCSFRSLPIILELVNSSINFNSQLHIVFKDSRYNISYLSGFICDQRNPLLELKEIFRQSIRIYDDNVDLADSDGNRAAVADQLVRLNDEIKSA
ncbi:hypothetical protein PMKS-001358 [Pichia membranifaciens]|uniref:Uncharacterized protein n=1 Tax=Pichia membranifaciens TaxID=4926 RepID=A0A1Q2YEB5_9ASCO|nr:hypothetical protein PMKS-001358 [Pichia membranifaciens]